MISYALAWCHLGLCLVLLAGTLHSQDKGVDQTQGSGKSENAAIEWNILKERLNSLGQEYCVEYDADSLGVSIRKNGKTEEKYGFFHWDERQFGRLELIKIRDNEAIVVKSDVRVEVKAPLFGRWRVEDCNRTSSMRLPPVGKVVTGIRVGSP